MSRTSRYKMGYFSFLIVAGILGWSLVGWWHLPNQWLISVVVLLLLPGRILGWFWRDLLRGLRLLREKKYEESARHSQVFLDELERRPWIRHLIWLGSSTYSRDPRALALNNLGAAQIGLGRLEEGRSNLEASIVADDQNPLPYFNLSRIARQEGDTTGEAHYLEKARLRGLTFGVSDRLVMSAQGRFARTDGRGTSA